MVSVVMIPVESIHAEVNNYSILPSLVLVSFYGAALIATSLLPILLYKKILVSGEKSPRVHKHIEINAFMAALREGACYVRRAGRMTCTRPTR